MLPLADAAETWVAITVVATALGVLGIPIVLITYVQAGKSDQTARRLERWRSADGIATAGRLQSFPHDARAIRRQHKLARLRNVTECGISERAEHRQG